MKAIVIDSYGDESVLQTHEVPEPAPRPGNISVRVAACGVNFIDIYQRSGLYAVPLPHRPGVEGAGTVVAMGEGVQEVDVGDRVAWAGVAGSYAEFVEVSAARVVKVPEGLELDTACAAFLQGMTAHFLCRSTWPLQAGQTCLIHAAAGGVGHLLVQMAKLQGARVIGTVSTDEKGREAREAGADEVIVYTREDFEHRTRELTEGRGVDVVYDSVGKVTFDRSLSSLRPRGMLALFGQSSGPVPPLDPQTLNSKGSLFLTRPSLFHHIATREELAFRAGELFNWLSSGKLRVRIGARYRLEDAAEAHRALGSRATTGKVVLIP